MRCEEVRPLLSAGLDGELEPATAVRVQAHLAGCALCAAEREAVSLTVRLLRAVPEVDPPAELRRRIGVALLEAERRAERRWLGLSWLARPQAAGWAWGATLGTIAATVGLMATRGPSGPGPMAGRSSVPSVSAPAPGSATAPVRKDARKELATVPVKKPQATVVLPTAKPPAPPVEVATAPLPKPLVRPAKVEPPADVASAAPSARRVPSPRRSPSRSPESRLVSVPSAGSGQASGRPDTGSRDTLTGPRSESLAPTYQPDPMLPMADAHSGTSGMTQMAVMPETTPPPDASDDLVELRRRLLDRPLHVPELGALKPTSASASREGWIRF